MLFHLNNPADDDDDDGRRFCCKAHTTHKSSFNPQTVLATLIPILTQFGSIFLVLRIVGNTIINPQIC